MKLEFLLRGLPESETQFHSRHDKHSRYDKKCKVPYSLDAFIVNPSDSRANFLLEDGHSLDILYFGKINEDDTIWLIYNLKKL